MSPLCRTAAPGCPGQARAPVLHFQFLGAVGPVYRRCLRGFIHHQGQQGAAGNHQAVQEAHRGQTQQTSQSGDHHGQELHRQRAPHGHGQVRVGRQFLRAKDAVGFRTATDGVQELPAGEAVKGHGAGCGSPVTHHAVAVGPHGAGRDGPGLEGHSLEVAAR